MKKILVCLLAALVLLALFTYTAMATDNGADDRLEALEALEAAGTNAEPEVAAETTVYNDEPEPTPDPSTGPWTWAYLVTIAGATAATLLIVQFLKVPLDKVWKIPTRLFVYMIALVIMAVATAYTSGLTVNAFLLCVLNAFIVALAAYGSYELTFAKLKHS